MLRGYAKPGSAWAEGLLLFQLKFSIIIYCMRALFASERKLEFVARSLMDLFKLLLPAAVMTGLFVRPIPWLIKVAAAVGLVVLFWVSV